MKSRLFVTKSILHKSVVITFNYKKDKLSNRIAQLITIDLPAILSVQGGDFVPVYFLNKVGRVSRALEIKTVDFY